jgi:hypothetical protein
MSGAVPLTYKAHELLKAGGVFVPSPLALDAQIKPLEAYQRLLTLYYIKSGARAVIPGAHTGEFALNDLEIFEWWLGLVKEMTMSYGDEMILMAAIGGDEALKQAEMAAALNYDIVLVAPTAFANKNADEVIKIFSEIASIIPTFAFELQRAIPGSYEYTYDLWRRIFDISYGAKGASFDTYRSINMLKAAAHSERKDKLTMLTGNDDRIVTDLLGEFQFKGEHNDDKIQYNGGLLGHFATDTQAAVKWVNALMGFRNTGRWEFEFSREGLAHAVNCCNMELFDALGHFQNSVWGVKYRLTSLGLLPGPYCANENGRPGQKEAIDKIYGDYPILTDREFLEEHLDWMKNEVGVKN